MPGQRKRKQRQQERRRRGPEAGAGRWEVVFETEDESQWRAHLRDLRDLRDLRAGERRIDWEMARIDTLCGRLTQPTTYRLSLFIPEPGAAGTGAD